MVCPNCGAQIDIEGKFCATCGARLPEPVPPPPPSDFVAVPPPPPPAEAPALPPAWTQAAPPAPQPQPPTAAAAPYVFQPPAPYSAPQYDSPVATPAVAAGGNPIAGLIATAGGAVAIASAWLPWITDSATGYTATRMNMEDASFSAFSMPPVSYMLIGGAIAAVCGVLLLLRVRSGTGLALLLGLGAIAGGALVVAVDVVAYGKINDTINGLSGYAIGFGLYVGIGGGVVGALGGLLSLRGRRR